MPSQQNPEGNMSDLWPSFVAGKALPRTSPAEEAPRRTIDGVETFEELVRLIRRWKPRR